MERVFLAIAVFLEVSMFLAYLDDFVFAMSLTMDFLAIIGIVYVYETFYGLKISFKKRIMKIIRPQKTILFNAFGETIILHCYTCLLSTIIHFQLLGIFCFHFMN
ncbi:hypothetical protein ACKWTF_009718 [Chironomus riparius]